MSGISRSKNGTSHHKCDGSFMFLPRYAYSDLTVFMRTGKNDYLNITDYSITEEENERVTFQSNSPFVIMFFSLFYTASKSEIKPYVCDITFDELLELSGICDKGYVRRFVGTFGEASKEFLAVLCAKKILDYQCGNIAKDKGNRYSFYRQGYICENGRHKKQKKLVFTKDFYAA